MRRQDAPLRILQRCGGFKLLYVANYLTEGIVITIIIVAGRTFEFYQNYCVRCLLLPPGKAGVIEEGDVGAVERRVVGVAFEGTVGREVGEKRQSVVY